MDHKPLTFAFRGTYHTYATLQIQHLNFISEFTVDDRYIEGPVNVAADAFPRINAMQAPTRDYEEIAVAQLTDVELRDIRSSSTSLALTDVPLSIFIGHNNLRRITGSN
ncbi:hypothetical protein MRX96_021158 [Rhipicephalus microplus]